MNLSKKNKIHLFSTAVFCAVIFLIRLPNIYIFPINSPFSSSNNIVRMLISVIIIIQCYLGTRDKKGYFFSLVDVLIGLYLLSQSLSVIFAQNILSFFAAYKDLLFALLLYRAGFQLTSSENVVFFCKILLMSVVSNILYQLLFFFNPAFFAAFFSFIFNEKYLQYFNFQYQRGRFFGSSLDESFIPIIYYFIYAKRNFFHKFLLVSLIAIICFLVIVSSWRTKFIIFIFSLVSGLLLFFKGVKKYVVLILLAISFFTVVGNLVSLNIIGSNIFDRFLLEDNIEIKSTRSRIQMLKEGVGVGLSFPLFGVGLGNYYDNLNQIAKEANKNSLVIRSNNFILIDDPHNLFIGTFASSGFFGLGALTILMGYLFINDILYIGKIHNAAKALILSFWGMFIYAFFNPWMNFSFLMPFWLIRGIVEKIKHPFLYGKK